MNIKFENLLASLTLEQARQYFDEPEKFIFCTDILDAADIRRSEKNVNILEDAFDALLAQ